MSVKKDYQNRNLDKEIKKIIPKNLQRNSVEYDSNIFEKKIEEKINKFNSGKKDKEKEKENYGNNSTIS